MGSPVSAVLVNLYIEWLEEEVNSAPEEQKSKLWKWYVENIMEVVPHDKVEQLTQHLNKIDPTGSIKFTYEKEEDKKLPFLGTLIKRKVKLEAYRKKNSH